MSHDNFFHKLDGSAILTLIGILILFSFSIGVTLIAPSYIDPSWTEPSSSYQKQMYEISDPNVYISSSTKKGPELQIAYHLKKGFSLLSFQESDTVKIIAPKELEKYITKAGEKTLKLTRELLLLRKPVKGSEIDSKASELSAKHRAGWKESSENEGLPAPDLIVFELFRPSGDEAFAHSETEGSLENWVDQDFVILEGTGGHPYHQESGVIFVSNPKEYRIKKYKFGAEEGWRYDPSGDPIGSLDELKGHELGFMSRKELIAYGEHIYAIEGCWYCHTDQTRTLIQDVVLNGSESYPAPPSSANEYIYQEITFPGTKRNGPDISRVGVKRPSRDWHKGHFWSPKTASKGSIMPAFQHFFDDDPRGTSKSIAGIPNAKFEAIFQYLMTKGTRITPPTKAWWLGKDPVQTKELIERKRTQP